ncbi:restriction endonuclease subunit S [Micromonospora inaquosa]|uniref:restriction endonuclease subunit S n=1 Tax=Micromonospora inaquosa TaxID=2203716 RepID=UPI0033D77B4E
MSEWKSVTVRELAVDKGLVGGPFGSSLVSKDYVPTGVPVIRGGNLATESKFNDDQFVFVSPEKVERDLSRNLALPGDVVFTQRGTLGQVGLVPSTAFDRYVVSQSQMRLRVDRRIALPEYVYYYFRSSQAIAMIKNHAIATGVPHINLGILGSMTIALPSVDLQQGICDVLGVLDDRIAANERVVQKSYELFQATWVKAASISQDFVRVSDVAVIDKGLSYKGEGLGGRTPLVNLGNFTSDGQFKASALKFYDGESKDRHWVGRNDLVMANTDLTQRRDILGQPALVDAEKALFTHHVFAVRPVAGMEDERLWLYGVFRDPLFRDRAMTYATGTTVLALPKDAVLSYKLPWPAEGVRRTWTDRAQSLVGSSAARVEESRKLSQLRNLLLPGLMSGAISVRHAVRAAEDVL